MAKVKSAFYCQNCGAQYSKWQGQCNSCKSWNTIAEELIQTSKRRLEVRFKARKTNDIQAFKDFRN